MEGGEFQTVEMVDAGRPLQISKLDVCPAWASTNEIAPGKSTESPENVA